MWDRWEQWLVDRPGLGVMVMALLGGTVAHIKKYERLGRRYTAWQHAWSILGRLLSASLGGLIVVFAWRRLGWPWEYGFIAAAIVGMFSTEFFDWLWIVGRAELQRRLGIEPRVEPPVEPRRDDAGRG